MSKTTHTPTHAHILDLRSGARHWVSLTGCLNTLKPGDTVTDRLGSLYVKAVR